MRIGALNTRMSEMELTVIDSEVETIGRVNGRSIWKLCTSSTLVFAGPERMDSIPGGGEEGRWTWRIWRTGMVSVSLEGKGQGEGEGYNKESVVNHSVYYKVRVAGEVTIDLGIV